MFLIDFYPRLSPFCGQREKVITFLGAMFATEESPVQLKEVLYGIVAAGTIGYALQILQMRVYTYIHARMR